MQMNKSQVSLVATKIAMLNSIYGISMPREAVEYQASLLSDLDFNEVMAAFDQFAKTNKTQRPPTPGHIREIIEPGLDDRTVANELARKIDKAISNHGWNWEEGYFGGNGNYWNDGEGNIFYSFKEAVISELGEIGWHVICSRGGWKNVRDSANQMEEGTFIAQMRDQIQSSLQLKRSGVDVARISLPEKRQKQVGLIRAGHEPDLIQLIDRSK